MPITAALTRHQNLLHRRQRAIAGRAGSRLHANWILTKYDFWVRELPTSGVIVYRHACMPGMVTPGDRPQNLIRPAFFPVFLWSLAVQGGIAAGVVVRWHAVWRLRSVASLSLTIHAACAEPDSVTPDYGLDTVSMSGTELHV